MLAIFERTVAKSPVGLGNVKSGPGKNGVGEVASPGGHFAATRRGAVTIRLGSSAAISYTAEKQNPLLPRLFASVDDIYCFLQGHVRNIAHLKQQNVLNKTANEVTIVIEAYRSLRDRGPYRADQVVRDLNGKFAFILFDCSAKFTFIASDTDGSIPFYWGTDSEDHLVLSDDVDIIKKGCGKSFAAFQKVASSRPRGDCRVLNIL